MIAAEQVAVAVRQEMADLAVGIVHHSVEDGHERSAALSWLRASAMTSTVSSDSIHSWHMPGPNGPSR